jgi:hypothetical protein
MGSRHALVKPMTIKLIFVASPINMKHKGERGKAGWLGIMIKGRHVYPRTVVTFLLICIMIKIIIDFEIEAILNPVISIRCCHIYIQQ